MKKHRQKINSSNLKFSPYKVFFLYTILHTEGILKKMKNIAVLVSELTTNYNFSVFEGIESYFNTKDDVRFIVSTIASQNNKENCYDYQYWTAIDLAKSEQIDAIIIITNSFLNTMKLEDVFREFSVFKDKPVFSVATPLGLPNSFYTHTICIDAYNQVITHMIEKHGKKRIAFFSAGLIDSPDSDDRLEAYREALAKNGIEFNPDLVYKGDFTPGTAKEVMMEVLKDKKNIPFDAIMCANDFTAGGLMLAMMDLGLTCPKDIAIFGFDDDPFATLAKPTISSINQSIPGSGTKAAEMAYDLLEGRHVDEVAIIQSQPVYRQSCGCITTDLDTSAYVDAENQYHPSDEHLGRQTYQVLIDKLEQTMAITSLVDTMNTRIPFSELIQKALGSAMYVSKITDLFVCLYDNPLHCSSYGDFFMPDEAKLVLYANKDKGTVFANLDDSMISFDPRERLIPSQYDDVPAGKYFLQPMTMHEINYGYIWCRIDSTDNTVISVNLKILTNILIQSIEFQRDLDQRKLLISRNQQLNMQTKTDELTQILNRRGFFDNGQQLIDLSISSGKTGIVFFCDLDGLKTINDTYGHDIGDLAIATEAKVLTALFRDSDLVGRLSGDEFGVVAPGMKLKVVPSLRERLVQMNEKFSKEAGLPFTLSISIGPIEFNEENTNLQALLSKADDNLYIEKREKHGERR